MSFLNSEVLKGCNSTRDLATIERVGCKNFETRRIGQKKNENIYK
jgi:hypothetical protein